jgi:hypothetical protein
MEEQQSTGEPPDVQAALAPSRLVETFQVQWEPVPTGCP